MLLFSWEILLKKKSKLPFESPTKVEMNVTDSCTHTTTTDSKNSQKEANNQAELQSHNALGPPKVPSLQILD